MRSDPYPIFGIFLLPLKRLRILLSMPMLRQESTSGSSPAFSQSASIEVGLEAGELESSLLDDSLPEEGCRFDHWNI